MMMCGLFFCGRLFSRLGSLAALAKFLLFTGGAARIALGAGNDVDNDTAVVLAAHGARAVRNAKRAALALRHPHCR